MIRIHKNLAHIPAILEKRGKKETESLCKAYDAGKMEFSFKKSIYSAKIVKDKLKKIQYDKCCFCESNFSHVGYGDVEHFRPKSGYRQNRDEKLTKPGYYWLAYEWSNLFYSCQLCNQRYKENLFPLKNKAKRAKNHHQDISKEKPLLIDPCSMNPEDYISFNKDVASPINDNEIGKHTIEALNLNRPELIKRRAEKFDIINHLYDMLENNDIKQEYREKTEKLIAKYMENSSEYASMIRCAVRDKFQY